MPKPPATPAEIEATREKIIRETICLINEAGFTGFSMRKLGTRLGVAAKTIYNYFSDKDELYLNVLSKGFSRLYRQMAAAIEQNCSPEDRLLAMARAYVAFGLDNPHYYNVLFNLDLPRFQDYIGTRNQVLADAQNKEALEVARLVREAIGPMIPDTCPDGAAKADVLLMQLWSSLHGMISLNNSRVTLEVGAFKDTIDPMTLHAVADICAQARGAETRLWQTDH